MNQPLLPINKSDLFELCTLTAYSANVVLKALKEPYRSDAIVVERVTRARRAQLSQQHDRAANNPRRYERRA